MVFQSRIREKDKLSGINNKKSRIKINNGPKFGDEAVGREAD